jgi:hypothetical protein
MVTITPESAKEMLCDGNNDDDVNVNDAYDDRKR